MAYQNVRGLRRLANALRYSMAGLRQCFRHEEAFRLEISAGLLVVPLGLWLGESGVERALLVGSWLVVLIVELLNSAAEAIVDRIGMERHELSARAKDVASAAVFLSILFCALVWLLVLAGRWMP